MTVYCYDYLETSRHSSMNLILIRRRVYATLPIDIHNFEGFIVQEIRFRNSNNFKMYTSIRPVYLLGNNTLPKQIGCRGEKKKREEWMPQGV